MKMKQNTRYIKLIIFGFCLILTMSGALFAQDDSIKNPFNNLPKNPNSDKKIFFDNDREREGMEGREIDIKKQEEEEEEEDLLKKGLKIIERNKGRERSDYGRSSDNSSTRDSSRNSTSNSTNTKSSGKDLIISTKSKRNTNFANSKEIVQNFHYPDTEILTIVKAIAKLTGKNFIYNAQQIKGKISIVSESSITVGDAWKAFLTALDLKGYTIIPSGEYLRIEQSSNAKTKQIPIYTGKNTPNTDQYITRIISLKYINAEEVRKTFSQWIPRTGRIAAYKQTNTLIITDTAAHIRRILELIEILDVKGFQESLEVIPILYAAAKDIANLIEKIISSDSSSSRRSSRSRVSSRRRFNNKMSDTSQGNISISQIIADERTNSLIVKANKSGIIEIKKLVRKLDTELDSSQKNSRIHVYRLKHSDAEQISKSLGAITSNSKKQRPKRGSSTYNRYSRSGLDNNTASIFQDQILISPDKATQSLVITASPQDFITLTGVIKKLDIPRNQVFVEAIIMELAINKTDGYGFSFINPKNGISFPSVNLQNFIAGSPSPGLSLGFKRGGLKNLPNSDLKVYDLQGLVELLQSSGSGNVVAAPQIVAMDNEESIVEISDEVPFRKTVVGATGGNVTTSFDLQKASLKLKVTPQINRESDSVKLKIEQTLQEFTKSNVPSALTDSAVGRSSRSTKTTVIIKNNDTAVISGLIREKSERTINKVPILGDIPVLGWLFKNSSISTSKVDLIIFITPHIITKHSRTRSLLTERIKRREEFIYNNLGGKDPSSREIQAIKDNLPDLNKIKENSDEDKFNQIDDDNDTERDFFDE